MQDWQVMCVIAVIILGAIIVKGIYDKLTLKRRMYSYFQKKYGKLPQNDYDKGRYEYLDYCFKNKERHGDVIDDITWNDLDMYDIFKLLNQTCTGIGEEYLYAALRMPHYKEEKLLKREELIEWLFNHQDERIDVQMALSRLGKMKNMGVYQYLDYLKQAPRHNPILNILLCAGLVASIVLTIISPSRFLILLLLFIAINMIMYFTYKNKSFFDNFSYMSGITYCAQAIVKVDIPVISDENAHQREILKPFKRLSRFGWLFVSGSQMGGTLLDLVMDYIKMLFHIDVILFDFALSVVRKNICELNEIMDYIGEIDMAVAVASYRELMKGQWCLPVFSTPPNEKVKKKDDALSYYTHGLCHPLINAPVANDLEADRSILLTGSNASGKSTFLKTAAINTILAQTIHTVLATDYKANFYRVYSSMALRDNLSGGESYFIVEIKSLKRIVKEASGELPVLCFIDEVLRGTNTIERIAASSQILNQLSKMNALCFAATHDIELTTLLEQQYDNYHFQEDIQDGQVTFDYKLYRGKAVSRNAIRLLGIIGFDDELIVKARNMASDFEIRGEWKL